MAPSLLRDLARNGAVTVAWRMRRVGYVRCRAVSMAALVSPGDLPRNWNDGPYR
jgi:hypothetical protein